MQVRRATVIGAGVMGSGIAAVLAGAGIHVTLLDAVPAKLTEEERRRGMTLAHPAVRNRLADVGRERALRALASEGSLPAAATLITSGNVEDDLDTVRRSDWIVEAVVEDLSVKRALLAKLEGQGASSAVVSSNTSGLSINAMVQGRSIEFRRRFLGTHFFNPPTRMKLVEVIPGRDTLPEVTGEIGDFLRSALDKGVVFAKDTPNFIANRIGAFTSSLAVKMAVERGYSVEEVDELTGPLVGRPRTGTFRLADLVGLDTSYTVRRNVHENLSHDPWQEVFEPSPVLARLVERGWLGDKSGGGFYKKEGESLLVLDLHTLDYRPYRKPSFASVERVQGIPDLGERLRALLRFDDRGAVFVRHHLGRTLVYAAGLIPEVSDDVVNVDRAMKWGYRWEGGPFQLWDALGPEDFARSLHAEGLPLPWAVEEVLHQRLPRFYIKVAGLTHYFDPSTKMYKPVPADSEGELDPPVDPRIHQR